VVTIYHNPKCRKSREGLDYLKSRASQVKVREYLKDPLTAGELDEILLKSGLKPFDLVRQQEEIFKTELKGKNFTGEEWKRIILENPKLLIRPIVVGKYRAVFAQPSERAEEVLKH
jgi:arsenate reductase (glutaredoxin)